jgi:ABC-type nitrate/sulfonate/bicarbonate transport system permease component
MMMTIENEPSPNATEVDVAVEELAPPSNSQAKLWTVRIVSIFFVLIAWEIVGRRINPLFMSYPTAIARASVQMIADGELLEALLTSLRTLLVGFLTASVIGITVGLLIGRYRTVDAATDWLVTALATRPSSSSLPYLRCFLCSSTRPPGCAMYRRS